MADRLKTGYEMSHPNPGEEVLITGISGYFPESNSVAALQENLFNKVDLVTEDDRRWKTVDTELPRGIGKIDSLEKFDASFFGIDYKLAHRMDPASRLLLERTYEAIIDAGMNPTEFRNTRTGVFAGCNCYEPERDLLYEKVNCNNHGVISCGHYNSASLIAQWLGTTGPTYTIDTGCSSSVYSLEQALKAIRSGVCDAAILCGSNLCLHPKVSFTFYRAGILSPQGRCRSFDEAANGYARAEAAMVCLIQKAKDSRRAYTQIIYAKTNCDGFMENGIAHPSGNMHRCILKEFYEECDVPIDTVEYMEAHATGTAVGDPVELNAIDDVMCKSRTEPLLIGSVKSNLGHAEGAAGLCSIAKICIAYNSGYIPPNLHFNNPQKRIPPLIEGRLKVITEKQRWNRGLTSLNSFGFGGANSHVLFKNFDKNKDNNRIPKDGLPRLVCISGRTKLSVKSILNYLETKSLNTDEIRMWHAIHENNIDGHKFRGFILLIAAQAGSVSLASDILNYKEIHRPICLIYSGVGSELTNIKELMEIPVFAATIHKCHEALKSMNVNLIDIISTEHLSEISSDYLKLYLHVTTTALQIALTDVIKSIEMKTDLLVGYGLGELSHAYADGSLTAEEAIQAAYYRGLGVTAHSGKKYKNSPLTLEDITHKIPPNSITIQITSENGFEETLKKLVENGVHINLIEKKTDSIQQSLFVGLGRLFEAGLNFKLANLYPFVTLPVSQSTPMLSQLIKWDHRDDWYTSSFSGEQTKLKAFERIVTFSMDDPDQDYLLGHCIGGRHLFPGSGYLVLVWETLAMMHGCEYKRLSVVFKDIRYLRATTIPKINKLIFNVIIHPVSGEFEVIESKATVVTGFIYPKKNTGDTFNKHLTSDCYKDRQITLSHQDFYKEIRTRGYEYGGQFKGVIGCNVDASFSQVRWSKNWTVFMDYVFQILILTRDTRSLCVPTSFSEISIHTNLHYEILNRTRSTFDQLCMDVFFEKDTQIIRCGGLEIQGIKLQAISNKSDKFPVFETYQFIPNYGKDFMDFADVIRINVHTIIENLQVYKFKAVEILNETFGMHNRRPILEEVGKVVEDIPQVWPDLILVTTGAYTITEQRSTDVSFRFTEVSELPNDKSAVLLVGTNLSQKLQILEKSSLCLREGGFLMSREQDATSIVNLKKKYDLITIYNISDEIIVLFKKIIKISKKVYINIDTLDQSFSWIDEVREMLKQQKKIVLYAHDDISGIVGLVKCLLKETGENTIQCLFIVDPGMPAFDPELQFYKEQLDKDLAFNIFKDSQWGSYCYFLMKNIDEIDTVPHAYLNVDTIGDLATLRWLQGGVTEDIQDKDLTFVHVYYSAINFRDLLRATGRIPLSITDPGRLAHTCAQGYEFVGKLSSGMKVIGIAEKAIANVLLCKKNLMMPVPEEWNMEEAASVLIAYTTVYLAFDLLGRMKAGESVLIHAGSGGVGQAAINVALHRGCEVFTTVGTPEKINFIKKLYPELKDDHVGSSRDTSFEEMIMKQTKGKGVDLVLNSLSEDLLMASIRCLGRRGRFLEIGRYDILINTCIEMCRQDKEISFHGVMLDYILGENSYGKKLFELVLKGIVNGEVRPLTHCTFERHDVEAAYRYMSGGKHIGKVIIKIREDNDDFEKPKPILIGAYRRYSCRKDYVYVLVGGLGGFGLELADWLILKGARKLVLVSSKGIRTGYQARRIGIWTSYGADINILTDDVTTEAGCSKILETAAEMGHVEAIFNLALILSDALIQQQSPDLFKLCFRPKALATFYLDRISRRMGLKLRDFVVFSSISCGRGNSGQSNYGLANSVMESICEKRRKDGLPGLAIQWGAIGDVGYVADLQAKTGEMEILGFMPQKLTSCLQSLDNLLMKKDTIVSTYVLANKKVKVEFKKTAAEAVAEIIGIKNHKNVSYQASLTDLGMDSLIGFEVKQTLERDFEIIISSQDLRTLSLAKLNMLATQHQVGTSTFEQVKTEKDDWFFDIQYFIQNFAEEEIAIKPYIVMTTKSNLNAKDIQLSKNETLFLIPGLDGCANSLKPLCRQLHTTACVLQLPLDNQTHDLQSMVDKLHKALNPMIKSRTKFNLLGYSYGTVPLLELAAKLESEGNTGIVFCIDASPTWIQTILLQRIQDVTDRLKLKNTIVEYLLEAALPNDKLVPNLLEKTVALANHHDKVIYHTDHLPKDLKYSQEFLETICTECINRLKIGTKYDINFTKKIKSPIILLRSEHGIIDGFPDNYELDKFTESDVKVHVLKSNHKNILEDPGCARLIETYMNHK